LRGSKLVFNFAERANFSKADLRGAVLDESNLFGAYMKDARIENISLFKTNIVASELKYVRDLDALKIVIQEKMGGYARAAVVYGTLRDYFDREHETKWRNYFHYREYWVKLKAKETPSIEKLKLTLNWLMSGFGVKPLRLIFVMVAVILVFSAIYSILGMPFSVSLEVSVRSFFGLGGIGVVGSSIMSLITLESVVGSMLVLLLVALIAKFNSMEI